MRGCRERLVLLSLAVLVPFFYGFWSFLLLPVLRCGRSAGDVRRCALNCSRVLIAGDAGVALVYAVRLPSFGRCW